MCFVINACGNHINVRIWALGSTKLKYDVISKTGSHSSPWVRLLPVSVSEHAIAETLKKE
jgi:hypothetical protein